MSFVRIDDIHLYGGLTEDAVDCYRTKKWLEENNIQFIHLFYQDENQCNEVIETVNKWFVTEEQTAVISKLPFLVYCEVDTDLPISQYPRKVLVGYDEITSKLKELYAVGR
jgi:hypothetical protein